jgi:hypothetical protein
MWYLCKKKRDPEKAEVSKLFKLLFFNLPQRQKKSLSDENIFIIVIGP